MIRRSLKAAGLFVVAAFPLAGLLAQSTTTYTYDAKGRVRAAARSAAPVSGQEPYTTYTYDKADNRTNVTVSNSLPYSGDPWSDGDGGSATPRFVVVPLNGYTIIPIN